MRKKDRENNKKKSNDWRNKKEKTDSKKFRKNLKEWLKKEQMLLNLMKKNVDYYLAMILQTITKANKLMVQLYQRVLVLETQWQFFLIQVVIERQELRISELFNKLKKLRKVNLNKKNKKD